MTTAEIYEILNAAAPKALSDEYCAKYGAYDNSGILVDVGGEVTKVLFSLDFSRAALERAKAENCNLIVTHHPVIYSKIGKIDGALADCVRSGISVISMHLNLDLAEGGIDESLAGGVREAAGGGDKEDDYLETVNGGKYGRVYAVKEITLSCLAENIKKVFGSERVLVYGNREKSVRRAASFCGAGADEGSVAFALAAEADVMISSDFKHHIIAGALEAGLSVIALTHYAAEAYGFEKYYRKVRQVMKVPCTLYTDESLL